MILVQTEDEADRLDLPPDAKVAYLTQTTLSVDDANRIIRRLQARFPQLVGPAKEDICYATQNRQEAVRALCAGADLVLVVGSQNSSNSQRLRELAAECGVPAHLIDGVDDLDSSWFTGVRTVVVTAGPAPRVDRRGMLGLLARAPPCPDRSLHGPRRSCLFSSAAGITRNRHGSLVTGESIATDATIGIDPIPAIAVPVIVPRRCHPCYLNHWKPE